jgi:hypothetical protein
LRAEAIEEKERNGRLLKQLEELTGEMRALKRKDEEREFEYRQQLAADEDHIRTETRKTVVDEFLAMFHFPFPYARSMMQALPPGASPAADGACGIWLISDWVMFSSRSR